MCSTLFFFSAVSYSRKSRVSSSRAKMGASSNSPSLYGSSNDGWCGPTISDEELAKLGTESEILKASNAHQKCRRLDVSYKSNSIRREEKRRETREERQEKRREERQENRREENRRRVVFFSLFSPLPLLFSPSPPPSLPPFHLPSFLLILPISFLRTGLNIVKIPSSHHTGSS